MEQCQDKFAIIYEKSIKRESYASDISGTFGVGFAGRVLSVNFIVYPIDSEKRCRCRAVTALPREFGGRSALRACLKSSNSRLFGIFSP
jgi:hypothetical protein